MYKTYVINLEKDKERMHFMDEQLKALGISYERFDAIHGGTYDYTQEYDKGKAVKIHGKPLMQGEVGCALSHRKVYDLFLNTDFEYAFILEDDTRLSKNFATILEKSTEQNQKTNKWEYLTFDYTRPGFAYLHFWFHSINLNRKKHTGFHLVTFYLKTLVKFFYIFPLSVFEQIRNWYSQWFPGPVLFLRPVYLAGAYLVTREGAKKLQTLNTPICVPADKLPNLARKILNLKFYGYAPHSAKQRKDHFESSILQLQDEV